MLLTQEQAIFDLGYEWRMYRTVHALLRRLPGVEDPVRDALIESLILHTRNLIETFCGNEGREIRDVLGIVREPMPHALRPLYAHASEQIVHLPPDRPAGKSEWVFADITPLLAAKIQDLRNRGLIPNHWEGDRNLDTALVRDDKLGPVGPVPVLPLDPISSTWPPPAPSG